MQLNPRKREGTEIGDGDAATVGKRSRIDDELQKKEGWKGKGVFFRKKKKIVNSETNRQEKSKIPSHGNFLHFSFSSFSYLSNLSLISFLSTSLVQSLLLFWKEFIFIVVIDNPPNF